MVNTENSGLSLIDCHYDKYDLLIYKKLGENIEKGTVFFDTIIF